MQAADVAQWDAEVGVLVVGFGGAGAAAAIEACDQGCSVMLVEAASATGEIDCLILSGALFRGWHPDSESVGLQRYGRRDV